MLRCLHKMSLKGTLTLGLMLLNHWQLRMKTLDLSAVDLTGTHNKAHAVRHLLKYGFFNSRAYTVVSFGAARRRCSSAQTDRKLQKALKFSPSAEAPSFIIRAIQSTLNRRLHTEKHILIEYHTTNLQLLASYSNGHKMLARYALPIPEKVFDHIQNKTLTASVFFV